MNKLWIVPAAVLLGVVLSACGERPQVIEYKQGKYQGKNDTPAWANAPYNGDRTKWEADIRTRNQAQNEYRRVN
jgi:hypothetical protein